MAYASSFSQTKVSTALSPSNKSRYKVIYPVAVKNDHPSLLPFSGIEIRDIRPDTTKLGFYRSTKDRHSYKYRFATNTADELTAFLTDHFQQSFTPGSNNRLVIYIKKLWLSEFDSAELSLHNTHVRNAWLYLKTEIYLQSQDAYYPIYRFDSVTYARKNNGYTSGGFISTTLLNALQVLDRTDFAKVIQKRKLDQASVDAFNNLAVATTAFPKPAKGVYVSFDEFKNGRPSCTDYEVRFESLADIIYVKAPDGVVYPKRNVWGFSDGETVFIRMGSNFFPLYNQEKTWEFYGTAAMEFRAPRMPILPGAGLPMMIASAGVTEFTQYEKRLVNLRAFQVDMENGKFY
ncbi:hypothetical protein D3H65_14780 [Paraflavitalea soli]|uniref:Uncharacterized protein n=1 Tax=Paraflavitalea soli TaxID=2315862 RepID=A0A3B7MQB0_9BACT|nr:hypothetical protein [Paraflavitalea soli]AXY75166.1 hypothetical protein D3H65_14780 [Paraflavitalea soli]